MKEGLQGTKSFHDTHINLLCIAMCHRHVCICYIYMLNMLHGFSSQEREKDIKKTILICLCTGLLKNVNSGCLVMNQQYV